MTLLRAAELGIDRFAVDRPQEGWNISDESLRTALIHSVYRQVLGQQHLMASERLGQLESRFRTGDLSVREFVRAVAQSSLYRKKFFEHSNAYRFIELNHKHLLGRAPQNREEMLHHFSILQNEGVEAEINSYLDSEEYVHRFGENTVPYLHGWGYSAGHQGRQFSWLMQLARGASASVKGSRSGHQSALNRPLHQNRAIAVTGALPPVSLSYTAPSQVDRYRLISTDGPFAATVSERSDLYGGDLVETAARRAPSQRQRETALLGSSGFSSRGSRSVSITVAGVAQQSFARSGEIVIRVPFSRMNEGLQRATALGTILNVVVG